MDAPASWGGIDAAPSQLRLTSLRDVEMSTVRFIDKPFLQAGTFHLLAGIKNAGKGTWLAHTASRVTRGELGEKTNVIWIALGEDDYGMDVKPRILAAGGDPNRVWVVSDGDFELPLHGQELEDLTTQVNAGLVVIDPLAGAILGKEENLVVRPALRALNHLAQRSDAVVIGVRHITVKSYKHSNGALSGILGSSDWVHIPRSILALLHDDEDRRFRHLFVLTGNRTEEDQPGLVYAMEGVDVIEGAEPITKMTLVSESMKDPDELLANRKTTRSDRAKKLMLLLLREHGGVCESDMLDYEVSKITGLATRTLREVRTAMKDRGLTKVAPVKDESGTVLSWQISLTSAGHLEASSLTSTSRLHSSLSKQIQGSPPLDFSHKTPANDQNRSPETTASGHLQGKDKDSADSMLLDPLEMAEVFDAQEEMS